MRALISRFLKLTKLVVRKVFVVLDNLDRKIASDHSTKAHDYFVKRGAKNYDMYAEADETYYADRYIDYIKEQLQQRKSTNVDVMLDMACGQARIIDKLLACDELNFNKIIGVDFSGDVLEQAKKHLTATSRGDRVEFIEADINKYLQSFPDEGADVILLLEVLYMVPDPQAVLVMIARKLRPCGVAFITMRSDYYYGLYLLRQGLYNKVPTLLEKDEGMLLGSDVLLNWTSSGQISDEFAQKYALKTGDMIGIGPCSGIPNDPHDVICRPSSLGTAEKEHLRDIEDRYGRLYPDTGRYILFTAEPADKASA